jgi:tetraacyldisaccharide 4'-kinase
MNQSFSARRLLFPLIPLYRLALLLRELRLRSGLEPIHRLRFPVVSIGNLSTGGSGKTPLTIALAKALTGRGLRVDVLSRGYGRQSKLAARVNSNGTAEDFGDEPLLIARETGLPVYVAARRYDAGLLAEAEMLAGSLQGQPPIVHLLDDGFQHRQLDRDVNILLLNCHDWQDTLLPAGNLREPIAAISRADVLVLPANQPDLEVALRLWGWDGPVWRLFRSLEIPAINGPVAAFCGIAHPDQFFEGLEDAGFEVALRLDFPDHYTYTVSVLEELIAEARKMNVTAVITTEKDLVRMGNLALTFPNSMPLTTARLRIKIEDQQAAIDWLVSRLTPGPSHTPL